MSELFKSGYVTRRRELECQELRDTIMQYDKTPIDSDKALKMQSIFQTYDSICASSSDSDLRVSVDNNFEIPYSHNILVDIESEILNKLKSQGLADLSEEDEKLKMILDSYVQNGAYDPKTVEVAESKIKGKLADKSNAKIKYFANDEHAQERKYLLDTIVETAKEENLDPRLILAIIQKENGFDGSHVNKNGKGYMALTGIAIKDTLLRPRSFEGINELYIDYTNELGLTEDEVKILKNTKKRAELSKKENEIYKKIVKYLEENKDNKTRTLNIKIGAKILVYHKKRITNAAKSKNKKLTNKTLNSLISRDYNGSAAKDTYSKRTIRILNDINEYEILAESEIL